MSTAVHDLTKLTSPALTENVLLTILQQQSGLSNINICNIHVSSATGIGEAYLSKVSRVIIEATGKDGDDNERKLKFNFIVKSIPNSPARVKTFHSLDFFRTEAFFYNTIWPALNSFQKSKNISPLYDSIPVCLAAFVNGKDDFIILDDVSVKGYTSVPRTQALDLDLTTHILKNFARFHATSAAYKEHHPEEFKKMVASIRGIYFCEEYRDWYRGAFNKYCNVAKDAAEKELPPFYLQKINELTSGDLYGNICKLLKEESIFSVISHGDCWGPNFLLRGSGDERKMILIDFQLMRYASAVVDIFFFMYVCVDPEVQIQHWDYLLNVYYDTYLDTAVKLGVKSNITYDMLEADLKKYGLCGFAICIDALTMAVLDDDDVVDLDTLQGDAEIPLDEAWIIQPIKDATKRRRLAHVLKHIIDKGFV